jgi:hypothetical protein
MKPIAVLADVPSMSTAAAAAHYGYEQVNIHKKLTQLTLTGGMA